MAEVIRENDDQTVLEEDIELVSRWVSSDSSKVGNDSASLSNGMSSKVPDARSNSEDFDEGPGIPALGLDWNEDGSEMFTSCSSSIRKPAKVLGDARRASIQGGVVTVSFPDIEQYHIAG